MIDLTVQIENMKKHIEADELVRGLGFSNESGKGCFVGCTIDKYDHAECERVTGVPEWLWRLCDHLHENMSHDIDRGDFALKLLDGFQHCSDFKQLQRDILLFMQRRNLDRVTTLEIDADIKAQVIAAIEGVIAIHATESAAEPAALLAARSAAESAESVAESAAESAASAAWSAAESARSAAWSAAEAANSAAESAWLAAESARSAALLATWSAAESAAESVAESAKSAAESVAESAASAAWSAAESARSAAMLAENDAIALELLRLLQQSGGE